MQDSRIIEFADRRRSLTAAADDQLAPGASPPPRSRCSRPKHRRPRYHFVLKRSLTSFEPPLATMSFSSLAWACFRLGRFHTLMGWVIFLVPTILTVVVYHAANADKYPDPVGRSLTLILRLFVCILSYRGAGLSWDDIVDRNLDARVARTKGRPIPAGQISVPGAVMYCLFQSSVTTGLFLWLLPAEALLVNLFGTALFIIYPFLKFFTSLAQVGGAVLIAAVVPVAWAACGAFGSSAGISDPATLWMSTVSIISNNWPLLAAMFGAECLFSFFHELVYGCQDTADDIEFGVHSMSILLGYERSKQLVIPLSLAFLVTLAYVFREAGLHWFLLILIPTYVLLNEAFRVQMHESASCSAFAARTIYLKAFIFVTEFVDFVCIQVL